MNKLQRQQNHQNVLELMIKVGKLFSRNQRRTQLTKKKQVKLVTEVIVKNLCYLNEEKTYHKRQLKWEPFNYQNPQLQWALRRKKSLKTHGWLPKHCIAGNCQIKKYRRLDLIPSA
jgi:hypothetical protein